MLNRHKEIVTEFALIGLGSAGQVNQGTVVVRMAPREERKREAAGNALPRCARTWRPCRGARLRRALSASSQGQRGEPLQFVLAGENLQEVGRLSRELQGKLAAEPGIGRLDTDLQLDLPSSSSSPTARASPPPT